MSVKRGQQFANKATTFKGYYLYKNRPYSKSQLKKQFGLDEQTISEMKVLTNKELLALRKINTKRTLQK